MKNLIKGALIAVSMVIAGGAHAATYIDQFKKSTNDGVFTLNAAQADYFGVTTNDHIAFYRPREGNGVTWDEGDTFDATTMFNSVTAGGGNIIGFLNGINTDLGYTGDAFDALGTTILGDPSSYFRGVAFLFSGDSNITFGTTSTFNANQATGGLEFNPPSAVPLPAGLPLLLTALGGVAVIARRRKAA